MSYFFFITNYLCCFLLFSSPSGFNDAALQVPVNWLTEKEIPVSEHLITLPLTTTINFPLCDLQKPSQNHITKTGFASYNGKPSLRNITSKNVTIAVPLDLWTHRFHRVRCCKHTGSRIIDNREIGIGMSHPFLYYL